ncbi:MAG: 1-deoxy-D-xylulose-5-phosphate reductoisomerase [Henriciella sp.]|uniref:1-deoxy-D-xylulose-5-phosphate reductoisomerase n=1 Tax=Henriciella sp. TaxID=1968823 RepID=UPI000C10C2C5|nr:1-deoxy-D-xylulose-5-phosphate reductoisomerase [Henriciella sp.]MAN75316.1 1-deoxy-D-xylulose-5-phosphate reductoisomerase [Henriciella sp.]MBF33425.1 1-deoxy-D-xylulose-5-phosphate reductoisomerase [Hyphomonadaceae bacterium]PHR79844.1 MAG: 1-deoxy-D-xylulose-5-phosphate reductoisomerase [Henriciella sp.]
MTKRISIIGSTGSIGQSALSVVAYANTMGEGPRFEIEALTAQSSVDSLARQACRFGAKRAVIGDETLYGELKERLAGSGVEPAAGSAEIVAAASIPVDRVVAAIVGIAGLRSTYAALAAGNSVALANKESMVCAGPLLRKTAARTGAAIVPTDSEHNAMFQVMENPLDVDRLILTASGGPFLRTPLNRLKTVTPDEACAHPRWSMGRKISVDSASFINKALELIEASFLFDVPESRIDVLVHPQSVIHSMVSYVDGSFLAQLGTPDMQTPIAHALTWPDRRVTTSVERLDLAAIARLDFEEVDDARFPAIRLAREALRDSNAALIAMNAANEIAVDAFLDGRCRFTDINQIVETAVSAAGQLLSGHDGEPGLEDIVAMDEKARAFGGDLVETGRIETKSEI